MLELNFDLCPLFTLSEKMATPPFQLFKSEELACIKYNNIMSERVSIIEASALDSSKDGTLFAVGASKKIQVCTK